MMFHAMGLGASDPYAGTDELGSATNTMTPSEKQWAVSLENKSAPPTAADLASSTATADCDPTQQVCHWYCYIPFMATSDCLASFSAGTKEIATGAGQAVGVAAGSAATGVVSGFTKGLLNDPNSPTSTLSMSTILMLVAVGGLAVVVLLPKK